MDQEASIRKARSITPLGKVDGASHFEVVILSLTLIMFFGCWNVKGLNDHVKQSEVKNFIASNRLSLCGLVETKVKEKNQNKFANAIFNSWRVVLC